jgi:small subunit ribosomal protein S1
VDTDDKGKTKRSLSMKRLEEDPFDVVTSKLTVGERVTGTVVRNVEKLGAFVDLGGVEGLVHISELSRDRRQSDPNEFVKVGQSIEVTVLGIDNEKHRISLSYKAPASDPWEKVEETYKVGEEITGTVDSVTNFGVFVKLTPRLTALLPMSEIGEATKNLTEAKRGDSVTAKIIVVDVAKKRITLSTRTEAEAAAPRKRAPRREENSDDQPRERAPRGPRREREHEDNGYKDKASFGTFGDVLASLKKK